MIKSTYFSIFYFITDNCRVVISVKAGTNNGFFIIKSIKLKGPLKAICSDGEGWEHVSVSLEHRCPTWEEMCFIKDLFWGDEDCVIQYHPPKSEYVNNHSYCLHLWKPVGSFVATPPKILVGI